MRQLLLGFFLALLCGASAHALNVEPPLPDAAQEARAQGLFHRIRCVVCQGEAVADSPAMVAADFRQAIRKEIASGKSDEEVIAYFVSRYGDAVLMQPPLKESTMLLWFGPLLLLGCAAFLAKRCFGTRSGEPRS
jgi:cytochrome c-type biogenesis protein CcmH